MVRQQEYQPRIPVSTYRLQLNREFTFPDARRITGYLADLGITDIYASSYLKARRGSLHGYDIVDFGEAELRYRQPCRVRGIRPAELKARGLGQIFDLVPNHMCVADDNKWWMDVLENGLISIYARFFEINWHPIKYEARIGYSCRSSAGSTGKSSRTRNCAWDSKTAGSLSRTGTIRSPSGPTAT